MRLPLAALCLALLLPPPAARAQQGAGRLSGEVRAVGGAPLAGASVAVRAEADSAATAGAVTGANGRFAVAGLPPGRYAVRVTHLGYAPLERPVEVPSGALELGTLEMTPAAIEVEGVRVEGERSQLLVAPDRTVYRTEDMPAVGGGTATDVLRTVPELEVDVEGRVSLRGTESVAIHINGRPSPLTGEALQNFLRQLPADRIERVEVVPNPSARYDPEGMGGILNLVLKEGVDVGFGGSASLNAGSRGDLGGSTQLAYQRGRWSVFGSGSLNTHPSDRSFSSLRQDLLAEPVTSLEQRGATTGDGRFDMVDLSAELKPSERLLFWASGRAYRGTDDVEDLIAYTLRTPAATLERYDARDRIDWSFQTADVAVGARHAVEPDRNQISVELRRSGDGMGHDQRRTRELLALDGALPLLPPEESWLRSERDNGRTTLQVDHVRPVAGDARLEAGYRGVWQDAQQEEERTGGPLGDGRTDFGYGERFHSAYLTLGRAFGPLSVQGGLRGEVAETELELPRESGEGAHRNRYTNVFPSANLALELGEGRQARFAYSKRVQRPWPDMLNPVSQSLDPLFRFQGNPDLEPKYTHSWTLDLSWSGSRGSLTASPYFRRTVNNWDQVVRMDEGVYVTTWDNTSSIDAYGSSLTASLRQAGPLSGFASASLYREVWDARNISDELAGDALRWSASVNATARATPDLSIQLTARYNAPRSWPQGWIASTTMTSIGVRQQLWNRKATLNLSVSDPLDVYRFRLETRDHAHRASSVNEMSLRSVRASLSYTFGRAPQQSRPRGGGEEEAPPPARGGG